MAVDYRWLFHQGMPVISGIAIVASWSDLFLCLSQQLEWESIIICRLITAFFILHLWVHLKGHSGAPVSQFLHLWSVMNCCEFIFPEADQKGPLVCLSTTSYCYSFQRRFNFPQKAEASLGEGLGICLIADQFSYSAQHWQSWIATFGHYLQALWS